MSARARTAAPFVVLLVYACSGQGPATSPLPTVDVTTAPTASPTATPSPAPAAVPPPEAERNTPPQISGIDTCFGGVGHEHVFELTLRDPDGDDMSWRAAREAQRGRVEPVSGPMVPSGSVIHIRYQPPDVPDENQIRVFVTDARGATTRMILYTRNR